jgi:lysozyme
MNPRGIDISHLNDPVNISSLPSDIAFVWIKATQGITFQDPTFQSYYQAVKALNNVQRGAYHFFNFQDDPIAQATNFLSRGVDFTLPGVLPPMLDLENQSTAAIDQWVTDNAAQCVQNVNAWLDYVKQQTGKDAIIYTYKNYLIEYLGSASWPNNGLWLAAYQPGLPGLPPGYTTLNWWQYSESGQLDGTTTGGSIDLDWFMGTQEELNALANMPVQA